MTVIKGLGDVLACLLFNMDLERAFRETGLHMTEKIFNRIVL